MPRIQFIAADGTTTLADAAVGSSVMQVAVDAGLEGIVGECGGSALCATCHVYVQPAWAARLPAPDAVEQEMLAFTASARQPTSRLSCQLRLTQALDGLIVILPERQA
jgi:ferredoxin, 2Fe-2S